MATYEQVAVFDTNLENELIEGDIRKIHDYVVNNGGQFRRWERWGKRRLAYEIAHRQYGYYVLAIYDLDSKATKELDRMLRITPSLIRFLITRVEDSRIPEIDAESVATLGAIAEAAPESLDASGVKPGEAAVVVEEEVVAPLADEVETEESA
ncbi:30S ribosomal protein S6 [bacterium]|nr:30S ribosomal protein S6 [bacterium]